MSETNGKQPLSFEEKLQLVQDLTGKIESGTLSLEDSVEEFEHGMNILGELDSELQDMNRKLTALLQGEEKELPDEDV